MLFYGAMKTMMVEVVRKHLNLDGAVRSFDLFVMANDKQLQADEMLMLDVPVAWVIELPVHGKHAIRWVHAALNLRCGWWEAVGGGSVC